MVLPRALGRTRLRGMVATPRRYPVNLGRGGIVKHLLVALGLGCMASAVPAMAFEVAPLFSENMVLQRDQPVTVWGRGEPGDELAVTLGAVTRAATVGARGDWEVRLPPRPAGGPWTLTVAAVGAPGQLPETQVFGGILMGDVWVSSGQSNMEWELRDSLGGSDALGSVDLPELRFFNVAKALAAAPVYGVGGKNGIRAWQAATGAADDQAALAQFSAVGFFFGRRLQRDTGVPIGVINAAWGGTAIEPWTPRGGFAWEPVLKYPQRVSEENATQIYNAMIAPLSKFAVKGFIWYQGESNLWDRGSYGPKLRALIESWRTAFGGSGEQSFYFVQLAPYRAWDAGPEWLAELWEAQAAVQVVPRTGMAVINDVGELDDIHPRDKRTVGERLALWALAKDYGQDLLYSGPVLAAAQRDGAAAVLRFDFAGRGLAAADGGALRCFELAGADGVYVPAVAVTDGRDRVRLVAPGVTVPVSVRFAWYQTAQPNLVNSAGLPISAFRTILR